MTEIPTYERKERFTPSGGVSGISEAFSPAINNAMNNSNFGAQLAVKAAVEYGAQEGKASGHAQPGRELLPAFTMADKAYVGAYHQEEFNTLSATAESGLKGLAFEALKNPSAQSMASYQQHAKELSAQLLGNVSKENKLELERSLTHAYESNLYHIAGAVEQQNKKILRENFEQSYITNKDSMFNYQLQGFGQAAKDTLGSTLKSIASAPDLSPGERDRLKKDALESYHTAGLIKRVDEASAKGGYDAVDELLAGLAKENLDGLNVLEQQKVFANAAGYVGKQRQLQQDAHKTQVAEIDHGIYTGTIQSQEQLDMHLEDLTTYEYLQLSETLSRTQEKRQGSVALQQSMEVAVSRNDGSINNFTDTEIQKLFNARLESQAVQNKGQPPTLQQQALIVAQIGRPVESFTNLTNHSVLRGTSEQALEAINQLEYVSEQSPNAFEMKDPQARAIFEMASQDIQNGNPADKAIATAREAWVTNVKDSEATQKAFEKILASPDGIIQGKFDNLFGINPNDKKYKENGLGGYTKAYNAFVRTMNNHMLGTKDINTAYTATKRDMENGWGASEYGIDALMQYPPDKAIPNSQMGEWFWNQQGFQLSLLGKVYAERGNGEISYKGKASTDQDQLFKERIYDDKLAVDGVEREIKWRANPFSDANNTTPAYYAYYTDDFGVIQPLTLPDGMPFSWQPVSLSQYLPEVGAQLEARADATAAQRAAAAKFGRKGLRGGLRFAPFGGEFIDDTQAEAQIQKFADEVQSTIRKAREGKFEKRKGAN